MSQADGYFSGLVFSVLYAFLASIFIMFLFAPMYEDFEFEWVPMISMAVCGIMMFVGVFSSYARMILVSIVVFGLYQLLSMGFVAWCLFWPIKHFQLSWEQLERAFLYSYVSARFVFINLVVAIFSPLFNYPVVQLYSSLFPLSLATGLIAGYAMELAMMMYPPRLDKWLEEVLPFSIPYHVSTYCIFPIESLCSHVFPISILVVPCCAACAALHYGSTSVSWTMLGVMGCALLWPLCIPRFRWALWITDNCPQKSLYGSYRGPLTSVLIHAAKNSPRRTGIIARRLVEGREFFRPC